MVLELLVLGVDKELLVLKVFAEKLVEFFLVKCFSFFLAFFCVFIDNDLFIELSLDLGVEFGIINHFIFISLGDSLKFFLNFKA